MHSHLLIPTRSNEADEWIKPNSICLPKYVFQIISLEAETFHYTEMLSRALCILPEIIP